MTWGESLRRTGRTTRMLQEVDEFCKNGGDAMVVAATDAQVEYIAGLARELGIEIDRMSIRPLSSITENRLRGERRRVWWDHFALETLAVSRDRLALERLEISEWNSERRRRLQFREAGSAQCRGLGSVGCQ